MDNRLLCNNHILFFQGIWSIGKTIMGTAHILA